MRENHPDLWRDVLPVKTRDSHKYDHGHVLIYGAAELTGATRLAAIAAARMGAGLVTVLAEGHSLPVYRTSLPAHIITRDDYGWQDESISAKLYGPGGCPVRIDFTAEMPVVLDADALRDLPLRLRPNFVLTPHDGEFSRHFPDYYGSRAERAKLAAKTTGAYILLKGAETIIAAPDGEVIVNRHASPYLASAGTGDVLSGMITGLLAQNMPVFEALAAACWIHGECGIKIGPGLVASDMSERIPEVLAPLI